MNQSVHNCNWVFMEDNFNRSTHVPSSWYFSYLPYGYQQPDTRPYTFLVDPRQAVKDKTYMDPLDFMGEHKKCLYRRRGTCQYDTFHETNTTYKLI